MVVDAHSGLRYLVLLAGLATVVWGIRLLVGGRHHDDRLYNLAATSRLLLALNVFLGVAVLFSGRFYPAVGLHIVAMLFALATGWIVPTVMRRRPEEERTVVPYMVGVGVSLGLVATGILLLGRPVVG